MKLYNPWQPERPEETEDGQPLHYRTHITHRTSTYDVYNPLNMTAQVRLYRWSRSKDFVDYVSINELFHFLFWNNLEISKRQMGRTIIQSLIYDPRKVKGVTKNNPKIKKCYMIQHPEELQYGLEWMISMWIWRLDTTNPSKEKTLEFLDDMAALTEQEATEIWIDPLFQPDSWVKDPIRLDWNSIWDKHEMQEQRVAGAVPTEERPPLRRVT